MTADEQFATLRAEVERLAAERDQAREQREYWHGACQQAEADRDRACAIAAADFAESKARFTERDAVAAVLDDALAALQGVYDVSATEGCACGSEGCTTTRDAWAAARAALGKGTT